MVRDAGLWGVAAGAVASLATEDPAVVATFAAMAPAARHTVLESRGVYESENAAQYLAVLAGKGIAGALTSAILRNPDVQQWAWDTGKAIVENPHAQLVAVATAGVVGATVAGRALNRRYDLGGKVAYGMGRANEFRKRYTPLGKEGRELWRDAASVGASKLFWSGVEGGGRIVQGALLIPRGVFAAAHYGLNFLNRSLENRVKNARTRRAAVNLDTVRGSPGS